MSSAAQPKFSWSDAWLLHAITFAAADHPATLREIIRMGDAIEKAVFSFEELSSGFAKLNAAGYIRSMGDRFETQPAVEEQFRSSGAGNDGDARSWFERFLDATPWTPEPEGEDPGTSWRYPGLTREAVAAAFGEYQAEMAEVLKKLGL